ncbi:tumor necrosis factor ligand superfamily member 6-like [Callorhinchus milii]|uniref:Tumor necrosis factor ligand superfamily member 6 n=1 Tax=Callorhinchus milii TaxID=7868 RepID=K4FUZ0_CALMI|nr:Fas ligand family member c [Callorhinchus milii]AFK11479.1 tumor necrosis factor ligand superfamily member 6-like protein [Callorhinchus milii]|eukprot:gi/632956120/ref/XP_007893801.1/ PREDICTED: tumor necrosis factor ligand superfamily member 6-like [Callorhinchus milii]
MEQSYKTPHVYSVDGNPSFSQYPIRPSCPVLVPTLKKQNTDRIKACVILILILALIILVLLACGIFFIFNLRSQIEKITQKQIKEAEGQHAKFTGHKQPIKPSENIREAAHLTGKSSAANTLLWDDTKDIAFTRGVRYKDGGLIINETGLFFIYSKIYFRNLICVKDLELEQTLFVRTSRYPKDMILMETKKNKYCVVKDTVWYINSYQAGIFKLHNGDHIYVNVSNTNLVSFDQTKTFFGLYKL